MSVPPGKAPIQQSMRAAFEGWRQDLPGLAVYAAAVGALTALVTATAGGAMSGDPATALVLQALLGAGVAVFFARALRPAVGRGSGPPGAVLADALRVYGSMAIVGFFLALVFGVALIPAVAVLGVVLAPYQARLEAAGSDIAAQLPIMQEAMAAEPGVFLGLFVVYGFLWMALTSRLYLAAPASVGLGRVMSFETWRWTQDNMMRIMAARLLLLVPAFFAAGLIGNVLAGLVGVRTTELGAIQSPNPALWALAQGLTTFVALLLHSGLEARLSAYLYQGLKPPA
ncbi:MAG: hypothetical protein KGS44_03725 [Alphaproteobacteria bacterium]|jgi:hypothetical protein|nr:hypothetical protein [Alphaproteobacteria bacterium]